MKKLKDGLRGYFVAGVMTLIPLAITLYVIQLLFKRGDRLLDLIPVPYNPKAYIHFPIPGLGAVLVLLLIVLVGLLFENYAGRKVVHFGETIVCRIPIVRPIYSSVKQLLMAVFSQADKSFKRVVLVQFPRRGLYSLGFVTGITPGEMQSVVQARVINVFLPTTPNPTSGFFLLIPEKDAIPLDISVEDAFKLVISGGLVSPKPDPGEWPLVQVGSGSSERLLTPAGASVSLFEVADTQDIRKETYDVR